MTDFPHGFSDFGAMVLSAVREHLSRESVALMALLWLTIGIAGVVTYFRMNRELRSWKGLFSHLLPAGTLTNRSARADFLFWLSRRISIPLLVLPTALSTYAAGHVVYRLLVAAFGQPTVPDAHAGPLMLGLFTISMLVAFDLSYYLYHRLQHQIPILWELHKVHHSATIMVGVTKDRVHPLDEIMNRWWDGIIPGITLGVWLMILADPVELTVFGLNVYALRNIIVMMDFVRHTHLNLSYGRWLNALFLCPHYHQLHHSVAQRHWDKNFGLTLTVWDKMFGTLVVPEPDETFAFGLQDREHDEYQSLLRLHLLPLKKIWERLSGRPSGEAPGQIANATDSLEAR